MKDVSCVDQLSFVKPVTNFQAVALDTPVVARLQRKLKYMKDVSYVDQLSFVKPVTNIQAIAVYLHVGQNCKAFGKLGKLWVPV